MQLRNIVFWNLGLIATLGLYGIVTDEPYWRDNGHDPWMYDYFFWIALAINGPSGFLADYLSWLTNTHAENRYIIQYAFWCLLLWPQWRLYQWFVRWGLKSPKTQQAFYAVTAFLIVVGSVVAYQAWEYGHLPSEMPIDRYFWFVRLAGLTCAGVVILLYAYFMNKQFALTTGSTGRRR